MKKANIILLIGQSNAVGVGFTKYLPWHFDEKTVKKFYDGYENVLINYRSHGIESNGFVKTRVNCTEAAKDTLGPEVGIAKNLSERYPNEQFFIVKYAFGGSNLYNDWLSPSNGAPYHENASADEIPDLLKAINSGVHPSAGWCYNGFIELLRESIALLQKQGYEPKIRALFWMQGESDSYSTDLVEKYIGRYDNLLRDIQANFAPYLSNCVYVDAGISESWLYYKEINAEKAAYAKAKGYVYLDTIGARLTTKNEPTYAPDTAHYDSDSTVKLGELFAENLVL